MSCQCNRHVLLISQHWIMACVILFTEVCCLMLVSLHSDIYRVRFCMGNGSMPCGNTIKTESLYVQYMPCGKAIKTESIISIIDIKYSLEIDLMRIYYLEYQVWSKLEEDPILILMCLIIIYVWDAYSFSTSSDWCALGHPTTSLHWCPCCDSCFLIPTELHEIWDD